ALELKYLTDAWAGDVNGERYKLLSQGAQDIRAYDVIKDVGRIEHFIADRPEWSGAVAVLANDPSYWTRPTHGRSTNADAFRIYEGQQISGLRQWGPRTGAGTMKGREVAIELGGSYKCLWNEYSHLPGARGRFRMLVFAVSAP